MDRYTTNIAAAQSGFIDNFIKPAFEVLSQILPETKVNLLQMEENKYQWKALEDDYDPKNKYTQKEIQNNVEAIEDGESEEDDIEDSIDDNILKNRQNSDELNTRAVRYTLNSSSKKKADSDSSF